MLGRFLLRNSTQRCEADCMTRLFISITLAVCFSLLAHGQTNLYGANAPVPYPRINASVWYEVDPQWPQRPKDAIAGAVPGVAVDRDDRVWIYTRGDPPVQVYAPDGRYLKSWPKPATNSVAHSIRIDRSGAIWLVDVGRHIVTKHSSEEGRVLLTLGTADEPGTGPKHFYKPTDVAIAPNGDIYVTDGYGNARVAHFDRHGRFLNEWGSLGTAPGQFSLVHALVCDSHERLYVADRNNARVQVFDRRGRLLDVWSHLMVPWGLWVTPTDEIWVCGSSPMIWGFDPKYPTAPLGCPPKDQLVLRFNTAGKLLQLWSFPKAADGQEQPGTLNWLHGIALDSKGNLYCTDIIGRRVQKFLRKTDPQASSRR